MENKMILVIGDSILDVYIEGQSTRNCPEAPAPVILNPYSNEKLGGAINVFSNLLSFQSTVEILTDKMNISKKTRIVSNGRIVARIDEESYVPKKFNYDVSEYNLIVLSDYNKGALHYADKIIDNAREFNVPVFVDPKKPFKFYSGATLLKANQKEVEEELGYKWTNSVSDAYDICKAYNFDILVVTQGDRGIFLYDKRDGTSIYTAGIPQKAVDVTGAGDIVLAALAHYYLKGIGMVEATIRANWLASKSVTVLGNYVISKEDIESIENGVHERGFRPFT